MSTNTIAGTEQVGDLIGQITQAADALKSNHREEDRLAALKAAQGLVRAFQKPQDHVYNLAYSVFLSLIQLFPDSPNVSQ